MLRVVSGLGVFVSCFAACDSGSGGGDRALVIVSAPSVATDGRALAPVVVEVQAGGVRDTAATPEITVALASGSGANLIGTRTVRAVAGQATFQGLILSGTSGAVQLQASAPGARTAASAAFPVAEAATQLVVTTTLPSTIAPLRAFDVTVELRTAAGAVATQLTDAVTLSLDELPDLLWHASGNGTRITELVEVTSGPAVVATLANTISGEIFGATWREEAAALVVTDISRRIGLVNPATGDECRYRNANTLVAQLRSPVFEAAVWHAGSPSDNNHYTIDPFSGVATAVGTWAFPVGGLTNSGMTGLARSPVDGVVFAIARTSASNTARRLVTVDLAANALTDVGSLGDKFASISFSPAGRLYGDTGNGAAVPESLYSIDAAASPTLVGALGNGADGEVIASVPRRLRGTTTVNAVAGVATFQGVWFENVGSACTLTARTAALASAPSNAVAVTGAVTPAASVQFAVASDSVAENVAGGIANVTLTLSAAVDHALPVMFTVDTSSTATIGGSTPDAGIAGGVQVVFAPGETSKVVAIPIVDDTTSEGAETLVLTIRSARLCTGIGANGTCTLTIVSDE